MTEYYKGYPAKLQEYRRRDRPRDVVAAVMTIGPLLLASGGTTLFLVVRFESPLDTVGILIAGSIFLFFTSVLV